MLYKEYLIELCRPWKLITLAIGIALLIFGSYYYIAPDWDIPISLIMAFFAYTTAPWCLRTLLERKWKHLLVIIFLTWFSVDGCYVIYWHFRNPNVLALMRTANFFASLSLYGLCGIFWLYRGSIRQLVSDVQKLIHRGGRDPIDVHPPIDE